MKQELELEVKVFNVPEGTRERLLARGGSVVKHEIQLNTVYLLGNEKIKFRETTCKESGTLTYEIIRKVDIKKSPKRIKAKMELSFPIIGHGIYNTEENYREFKKFIEWLGGVVVFDGVKHRESISYDDYLFEFDSWNEEVLPIPYMEIEFMCVSKKQSTDKIYQVMQHMLLRDLFTKKERNALIISTEGIMDISEYYKKTMSKAYKGFAEKLLK